MLSVPLSEAEERVIDILYLFLAPLSQEQVLKRLKGTRIKHAAQLIAGTPDDIRSASRSMSREEFSGHCRIVLRFDDDINARIISLELGYHLLQSDIPSIRRVLWIQKCPHDDLCLSVPFLRSGSDDRE